MTETLNVKQEQYIVEVILIVHKFSTFSVDVKNQLFRSYISCLYCSALWLKFSAATFSMTRVAYNNVYRALMGISRGYGHSISREYCTNNIDGFQAVLSFVSRRDVWMQVNYVNIYINNHNTTRQIAAPKPTDFRLFLRNNVTSVPKWYITYPYRTLLPCKHET